ncbi:hypothetical protein FQA39_LY08455 [Lamprigera yunnana]|nr:hypothetical protein FQA39_LY08455 [Lamprigera yunnana]
MLIHEGFIVSGECIRRSSIGFLGKAKIRTLKMTIIIVVVFFICWTPYYVMSIWYWCDRETASEVDPRIQKGLFLFACTNSCMNPIVYGMFNIRPHRDREQLIAINSKSGKVPDGVKTFLDKAKSRNFPLHLWAIMMFNTDSCENNTVEEDEVKQSINLPWSIPKDYDANNEARLLRYGNAAEETLINSTRYDLDNEDKYIDIRYSTHLNQQQCVLDQSFKNELSIQNMCKTDDITDDVKISYHWEYSEGLSLPIASMIAVAVSDTMRNGDNFMKTITLQHDYRTCSFSKCDVVTIIHLKPIINYLLEIMRSSGFKEFYDNIVERVIMHKSKRDKIGSMAGINVDDFQVYDDGVVYKIFEQLLNSKYNINSYNVLCVMEMYRHRPGYILTDLTFNQ